MFKKGNKKVADEITYSFGFKENEKFYYFGKDLFVRTGENIEIFWMAFCKWKKFLKIPKSTKSEYLHWIEEIVDKRTKVIVGGQFRNYYANVALLISTLGEVKESMGEQGAR